MKIGLFVVVFIKCALADGCAEYRAAYGIVCMCNETYCDSREAVGDLGNGTVAVYTSSKGSGKRMFRSEAKLTTSDTGGVIIEVDDTSVEQRITGFGGAFTDASAYHVMDNLSPKARDGLFSSYFGALGNAYSVGRVPLGSSDFSAQSYSLVENGNLATFQLRDDRSQGTDYKLEMIQEAMRYRQGRPLQVFMSIWSAPVAWKSCKTSPKISLNTCGGLAGRILGQNVPTYEFGGLSPDPAIRDKYAKYYLKFIEEYHARNVTLYGLTTQNEPSGNPMKNKWENTFYTPQDEFDFAVKHLGPVVKKQFPGIKLMIGDDQYTSVNTYGGLASKAPTVIDGVTYHWYRSLGGILENTKAILFNSAGGGVQIGETNRKYKLNNTKPGFSFTLATEASNGFLPGSSHVEPGSWNRGYAYSRDIIHQLGNGAAGWVDWNLVLDSNGGPNHANNFVDAAVIWLNRTHFFKNPMFYSIGHFSSFVPPGSTRLGIVGSDDSYVDNKEIETVAFRTPNNQIVVVAINDRLETTGKFLWILKKFATSRPALKTVSGNIKYKGQYVPFTLQPHEIQTFVFSA